MCIYFILCLIVFKDKVNFLILVVSSCKVWGCYLCCVFIKVMFLNFMVEKFWFLNKFLNFIKVFKFYKSFIVLLYI